MNWMPDVTNLLCNHRVAIASGSVGVVLITALCMSQSALSQIVMVGENPVLWSIAIVSFWFAIYAGIEKLMPFDYSATIEHIDLALFGVLYLPVLKVAIRNNSLKYGIVPRFILRIKNLKTNNNFDFIMPMLFDSKNFMMQTHEQRPDIYKLDSSGQFPAIMIEPLGCRMAEVLFYAGRKDDVRLFNSEAGGIQTYEFSLYEVTEKKGKVRILDKKNIDIDMEKNLRERTNYLLCDKFDYESGFKKIDEEKT